ncbi:MAG TPA: HD domain-containing protein [Tepidisphaeraceae bacterium]|nr:HD domain-containing protein [Tepidisphaeraceae bacterium]
MRDIKLEPSASLRGRAIDPNESHTQISYTILPAATMAEKIIRDPVHDVIALRLERPVEALLFRLINAAEFQRLRRVRQLGFAGLAYPGADHSRYSHSLGVMETGRKMIEQLRRSFAIDEQEETICLCACLLHDLGHGPFSHVFERVSGFDHEELTRGIVEDSSSQVHQVLAAHEAGLPARVAAFMAGTGLRTFLCDILSSQLDADRLDYLLRDNLMTGSRYGDYDLTWLLHALTIDEGSGRLAVTWKGVSAVEAYLQSRFHMYRNVYFHKVVRSAEGMVKLALQRARRLAVQERLPWPRRDDVVYKSLLGQRLSTAEFTDLDDVSMLHCFKLWTTADDAPLAALCNGLLYRKLFKTIDLTPVEAGDVGGFVAAAEAAVAKAGGDPAYDLFYDEPKDTQYQTDYPGHDGAAGDILVRTADGGQTTFAALSPLMQALGRQLMFRRLHVNAAYASVVLQTLGRPPRAVELHKKGAL